eukprot:TRINITY_DN1856_c0_g1_i2.p1 TRINITY_DN1856_c0_g1~~TRINITY_DN1856_c0_g1_i2.p1  ORF type:complete len:737 (+),score=150.87 TRINITY_DN1856_c0_g1_i2:118-2328(+)
MLRKLGCRVAQLRLHSEGTIRNVRNIGVVAHIDAGKTTTTERMLYFSEAKSKMGDVDMGNTTTDYMDQERERGITIQSALTKLKWGKIGVWIIDTPGHVDFTMEVERTLRVLDGAVAVFDGVKGVEAQSRTVLQQAAKFQIPFITYVNKMDRSTANFTAAIDSVENLINIPVVPLQAPLVIADHFVGFADLLSMRFVRYTSMGGVEVVPDAEVPKDQLATAKTLRMRLLDSLSGVSDVIADKYLECLDANDDEGMTIPPDLIKSELTKATKARKATPAVLGSSAKSIGIQPLLDAIADYLPSPVERPPLEAEEPAGKLISKEFKEKDPLAAVVFKVQVQGKDVKSVQRATLVRVYSGVLKPGMKVYNSTRDCAQTIKSISIVDGNDFSVSTDSLGPGGVGCVWGLNRSFTGDTLCADKTSSFVLEGVATPVPVVSMSVEPYSEREDTILEQALEVIQLEDPSISHSINEYGQTVLSGMGSLHLEVTKTKIERGWGLSLESGPVKIKHREYPVNEGTVVHTFNTVLGDPTSGACVLELSLQPIPVGEHELVSLDQEVTMSLSNMLEEEDTKRKLTLKWLPTIKRGVLQGLGAGPLVRDMVSGVKIDVASLKILPRGNEDTVGNAADYTTKLLLAQCRTDLLEPCLEVTITIYNPSVVDTISQDILGSRRGSIIDHQNPTKTTTVLTAVIPVSELTSYASNLLSLSGGEAHHTTRFKGYRIVSDGSVLEKVKEDKAIL